MSGNCLIVYTSMTGNTEEISYLIAEGISQAGKNVDILDILEVNILDLKNYNGILLGAYTWGDGDLPEEFLDFYEEMKRLDLKGKKAAAFGSCDASYDHRGGAVDILMETLADLGADLVADGLKIDNCPTDIEKKLCIQYGKDFAERLEGATYE